MKQIFNYGCAALVSTFVVGNAAAQTVKKVGKERPNVFFLLQMTGQHHMLVFTVTKR